MIFVDDLWLLGVILACDSVFEESPYFLEVLKYSQMKCKSGICFIIIQWPEAREEVGVEIGNEIRSVIC